MQRQTVAHQDPLGQKAHREPMGSQGKKEPPENPDPKAIIQRRKSEPCMIALNVHRVQSDPLETQVSLVLQA